MARSILLARGAVPVPSGPPWSQKRRQAFVQGGLDRDTGPLRLDPRRQPPRTGQAGTARGGNGRREITWRSGLGHEARRYPPEALGE